MREVAHVEGKCVFYDAEDCAWGWPMGSRNFEKYGPWTYEDGLHGPTGGELPVKAEDNPADPKRRYGATKPNMALIPGSAKAHCALALEDGAKKYGPYNWRVTKVEAMTYLAAALRHLEAYIDGQDNTGDTDIDNLGAVMACAAIVIDARECGALIDNRPPKGTAAAVQDRLKEWKIAQAAKEKP